MKGTSQNDIERLEGAMSKCQHRHEGLEYRAEYYMGGMVMFRDFLRCKCGAEYSFVYHRWSTPNSPQAPHRGEEPGTL